MIDEAGQALEAACWIAMRHADRVVLAGDHLALWGVGEAKPASEFPPPDLGYYGMQLLGGHAVTGDIDGKLHLWTKDKKEPAASVLVSQQESVVLALEAAGDGKHVAVAVEEAVVVYDAKLQEVARLTDLPARPSCMVFGAGGKTLWCGMQNGTVIAWKLD